MFRNIVDTRPTKKPKLEDQLHNESQEDIFGGNDDPGVAAAPYPIKKGVDEQDADIKLEEFELELDEHCDFTLMQFVQGSQSIVNLSSTKSTLSNVSTSSKGNTKASIPTTDGLLDEDDDFEYPFSQSLRLSQLGEQQGSYYGLPDKVKRLIQVRQVKTIFCLREPIAYFD